MDKLEQVTKAYNQLRDRVSNALGGMNLDQFVRRTKDLESDNNRLRGELELEREEVRKCQLVMESLGGTADERIEELEEKLRGLLGVETECFELKKENRELREKNADLKFKYQRLKKGESDDLPPEKMYPLYDSKVADRLRSEIGPRNFEDLLPLDPPPRCIREPLSGSVSPGRSYHTGEVENGGETVSQESEEGFNYSAERTNRLREQMNRTVDSRVLANDLFVACTQGLENEEIIGNNTEKLVRGLSNGIAKVLAGIWGTK